MDMTRIPANWPAVALLCALAAGCAAPSGVRASGATVAPDLTPRLDPGDPASPIVQSAVAVLAPTEGHDAHGTVTFTRTEEGLRVRAELHDLVPGRHAYHVHVFGDLTAADGTSAGTHFNFRGSSMQPPADIDRITGNLGELVADEDGHATHETVVPGARLTGGFSILGRAVVVHAKGNDPASPPIGAAGGRVACGVVGIAAP